MSLDKAKEIVMDKTLSNDEKIQQLTILLSNEFVEPKIKELIVPVSMNEMLRLFDAIPEGVELQKVALIVAINGDEVIYSTNKILLPVESRVSRWNFLIETPDGPVLGEVRFGGSSRICRLLIDHPTESLKVAKFSLHFYF